jgi:FAD/FMN-containing dehydrogenase
MSVGREGIMTQMLSGGIAELRAAMTGPVIGPADADYDDARRVWNADIDRRPAIVARCESAADVAAAVVFATGYGLEIAVRGGAHSFAGMSVVDGGLMIDLSRMNQVVVDTEARRARVGGGALLGDLDAATQQHGFAVPAGVVSHTGVGGLTLGGGLGWLTRRAGLSLDAVTRAEVVTADGRVLHANAEENPDLFWAIRGGGGNFGVVTEFEYRLHEVGPMVQYGMLFWELDRAGEALRLARRTVADLALDLNILVGGMSAPPAPFVPAEYQGKPGIAMMVVGFGSAEQHGELLAALREELPPLFEVVSPMPYVELQRSIDERNGWGFYCYDKGTYVEELTDDVIAVITEQLAHKAAPGSALLIYRLDGAYSEVGEDDTAFSGGRSPRYAVMMVAICPTPELLDKDRAWARSFWTALQPYSLGIGSYVNAISDVDADDRVRASYGSKYERLARIKAQYDPGNVFHRNANIPPA